MPISVYLDTHHVSRMASGKSDLAKFITDPRFSFTFSTSHVVECLPKAPRENAGSISRLNIILGPDVKWLRSWGEVASLERRRPAVELQDLFCGKHDLLFPNFKVRRSELEKRARSGLKEVLKDRFPDQNQRRSVQAKLLKNGKLTAEAFKIIGGEFDSTVQRVSTEFPEAMPLLGPGGVYDFLQGKISESDFKEKYLDALADPISLATMSAYPDLSSILELSRLFWMQMEELSGIISRYIANVQNEVAQASPISHAKVRTKIASGLNEGEFREAVIHRIAGVQVQEDALVRMPGTRLFADLFCQYILEKIDRYANPASVDFMAIPDFLRSDVADFTHVFYHPYVHIFGCDGAMRERMKKANWPIANVVTTDREFEAKVIEIGRG